MNTLNWKLGIAERIPSLCKYKTKVVTKKRTIDESLNINLSDKDDILKPNQLLINWCAIKK